LRLAGRRARGRREQGPRTEQHAHHADGEELLASHHSSSRFPALFAGSLMIDADHEEIVKAGFESHHRP
jgi:hypothetical protein